MKLLMRKLRRRTPELVSQFRRRIFAADQYELADHSRWHPRADTGLAEEGEGLFASQRLRKEIFKPVIQPAFRIASQDKIFAIGSCFARGIELALKGRGFAVESAATEFDEFETISGRSVTPLGFTNKYTTFAMLNELRWALDPEVSFPDESLVDVDGGVCIDPHINPTLRAVDRAGTLHRRRIMIDVTRRIRQCRIVFFTLGLVEAWYDKRAQVWLNSTPTPAMQRKYPRRYEFAVTDYAANLTNLEGIHDLLKRYGHRDAHMIVTVSPVPLNATFSGEDIVVANTFSKSTLRTVASEWARRHKNVQYFPSYEIVMNSDRHAAWMDDLRHVRGPMTSRIMDYFVQSYVPQ